MIRPGAMIMELIRSLFKKPVTTKYPFDKARPVKKFRGRITFRADKCIGCKLCMKDCPSDAIQIVKVGEKRFDAVIDLGKCIYCGQCVESCMKKALECTEDFELAQLNRGKLTITYHEEPKADQTTNSQGNAGSGDQSPS